MSTRTFKNKASAAAPAIEEIPTKSSSTKTTKYVRKNDGFDDDYDSSSSASAAASVAPGSFPSKSASTFVQISVGGQNFVTMKDSNVLYDAFTKKPVGIIQKDGSMKLHTKFSETAVSTRSALRTKYVPEDDGF